LFTSVLFNVFGIYSSAFFFLLTETESPLLFIVFGCFVH